MPSLSKARPAGAGIAPDGHGPDLARPVDSTASSAPVASPAAAVPASQTSRDETEVAAAAAYSEGDIRAFFTHTEEFMAKQVAMQAAAQNQSSEAAQAAAQLAKPPDVVASANPR